MGSSPTLGSTQGTGPKQNWTYSQELGGAWSHGTTPLVSSLLSIPAFIFSSSLPAFSSSKSHAQDSDCVLYFVVSLGITGFDYRTTFYCKIIFSFIHPFFSGTWVVSKFLLSVNSAMKTLARVSCYLCASFSWVYIQDWNIRITGCVKSPTWKGSTGGAWLVQSEEQVTLDLGAVSWAPCWA